MHSFKKKVQWSCLLLFAIIPFLFSSSIINHIRLADLIRNDNICQTITFYYDNGRSIKAYTNNQITGEEYVLLPAFTNMNEIEIEAEASIGSIVFSTSDYSVTVEKGKKTTASFETDTTYDVSFYNKHGKLLATDTIIFLKSANLPALFINTETGSMESLDNDKTYSEAGSYEMISPIGEILFADNLSSISARGNQTFNYEKKSYQIDLKQPEDFLGMGESDTWILLCNVTDSSYIRNKLTYDMAISAGMEGSPQSEYIDVYFNNAYAGMYLLTEKIEFAENRLEYSDLESKNLEANNGTVKKSPTYESITGQEKAFILANNPPDITGGYLIERDYGYKVDETKSSFTTNLGEQFVLKNPSRASVEEIHYIDNLMQEIEDAILAPDGINPNTGKHYSEYIDLDSWADKYLVEEICRNNGAGATSSYFYKPSDTISTKVFGGPVWDYDKAYGNFHSYNQNTRDLSFLTLHQYYSSWFYYLYQHDDFVYTVKQNYREKFSNYMDIMANQKIAEYVSLISASAKMDNARFANIYSKLEFVENPMDYNALSESIRQFIIDRKNFLDQVWLDDSEIVYLHLKYDGENGNRFVGLLSGDTLQNFPFIDAGKHSIAYWMNEKTGEQFTLNTPVTEDTTIIPIWEDSME